jgi:lipopolysaccharide transport system ATP-binding protein
MKHGCNDNKYAVKTNSLTKSYASSHRQTFLKYLLRTKQKNPNGFIALDNITIEIPKGSCFGILGLNGSGKSTFLQLLSGILKPCSGSVQVSGQIAAIFELGSGFNLEFTGRENIRFYCSLMGIPQERAENAEGKIVSFAELGSFIDMPISTYSSGMIARLGFATRAFLDFDILILDEVLSVGDAYFQRKCFRLLEEIRACGKTVIFVSHSINQILEICDRAMLLHEGKIFIEGEPKDCAYEYFEIVNRKHSDWKLINLQDKDSRNKEEGNYGMGGCSLLSFSSSGAQIENGFLIERLVLCKIQFCIHANIDLTDAIFGLNLRTREGTILTGRQLQLGDLVKSEKYEITVDFNCILNCGNYFLSCGLTSIREGNRVFEARHLDFQLVSVSSEKNRALNHKNEKHSGLFSLFDQMSFQIQTK